MGDNYHGQKEMHFVSPPPGQSVFKIILSTKISHAISHSHIYFSAGPKTYPQHKVHTSHISTLLLGFPDTTQENFPQ